MSRWLTYRARRDARELRVTLVFLQAVDECQSLDGPRRNDALARHLNFPGMHMAGNIHGVRPAGVGGCTSASPPR